MAPRHQYSCDNQQCGTFWICHVFGSSEVQNVTGASVGVRSASGSGGLLSAAEARCVLAPDAGGEMSMLPPRGRMSWMEATAGSLARFLRPV
jgi:hypothetical protein